MDNKKGLSLKAYLLKNRWKADYPVSINEFNNEAGVYLARYALAMHLYAAKVISMPAKQKSSLAWNQAARRFKTQYSPQHTGVLLKSDAEGHLPRKTNGSIGQVSLEMASLQFTQEEK